MNTIRTITGHGAPLPILWADNEGTVHACEGSDIHPGIRLLWTLCEKDVPANTAFTPGDGDVVTCMRCAKSK